MADTMSYEEKASVGVITRNQAYANTVLAALKKVKVESGCAICSYRAHDWNIVFHHVDKNQSLFNICSGEPHTQSEILSEWGKCVILCRHCQEDVRRGVTKVIPESVGFLSNPDMALGVGEAFDRLERLHENGCVKKYRPRRTQDQILQGEVKNGE